MFWPSGANSQPGMVEGEGRCGNLVMTVRLEDPLGGRFVMCDIGSSHHITPHNTPTSLLDNNQIEIKLHWSAVRFVNSQ